MERLKGVLLGLAVYLASVQLSRVTGINQWLYIIWSGSLIVAYGIVVEVKDKAEKKATLYAVGAVTAIGTVIAIVIGYVGENIDKWL